MSAAFDRAWRERSIVAQSPTDRGLFLQIAPMDNVTDWVHRRVMTDLCAGQSGISACVSEFVRVTRDAPGEKVILRQCPELLHGGRTRAGVPVFVQLLGGESEPMAHTAATAAELGVLGIDLNFGCPARTVNNHLGGAFILKSPRRLESIVAAVRAAVPDRIPVTAKIRLGWDESSEVVDLARAAEAGGASWLAVHARTRAQLFRPPVDWAALGQARRAVRIPVVANGDLNTPDDIRACARASGCHAFMIGRGAMGRPHLFRQIRGLAGRPLDRGAFVGVLREYVGHLLASGASERSTLGRLKQWLRMAAPASTELGALFDRVKAVRALDAAWAAVAAFHSPTSVRPDPHHPDPKSSGTACPAPSAACEPCDRSIPAPASDGAPESA
jgi:tRNA-dihydrouridine synthase C